MQPTIDLVYYGVCVLVSAVVFALAGFWYLLPRLTAVSFSTALIPLLLFSAFRVNGLYFLIPGVASPHIPAGFAVPAAYGDAASAILAIVTAVALRYLPSAGIVLAWIYSVLGSLDLINALAQVAIQGVMPADFAGTWILPTINVPALIVVHVLIFVLLLRPHKPAIVTRE